jgi:hypothetical protein
VTGSPPIPPETNPSSDLVSPSGVSDPVSDSRAEIESALDAFITPELLNQLFEKVLRIEKQTRGYCPKCKTLVPVTIPDSKAVVSALMDLLVQAKGRPGQAEMNAEERQLVFVNEIVLAGPGANGS